MVPGPLTPAAATVAAGEVQAALLAWFADDPAARRDLPWRRTRDPWSILVSEVMLQQTQVARVVPVFVRFLDRFPTPAACAAAAAGDVVRAWSGLGYNRRAVNLHHTETIVMKRHGGRLPTALADLVALPGVGPYTARAVLAFSAEADVGVLDTNAARVLARVVAGRPLARDEAQRLADALVPRERSWAWNSAVLDLGATVCTATAPRCPACPVERWCVWASAGGPGSGPDPAEGSVGTGGRQAAFGGSDRQGRGRLVATLRRGPLPVDDAPAAAGWPGQLERTARVVAALVADGLATTSEGLLSLP